MLINTKWYGLWKDWKFELSYHKCGYFDGHPEIHISMFGLHSVIRLPWINKEWMEECDSPKWGIAIHDNIFWIFRGGKGNMNGGCKWWAWDIPFFSKIHVKHAVETMSGMVDSESLGSKDPYVHYSDDFRVVKRHTIYIDSYDNSPIGCTYWREYREWRPKWLTWTSLFATKRNYIEIEFEKEVGSQKGTWKGGVMGCSYDLLPGETPEECIRRMEKERKF